MTRLTVLLFAAAGLATAARADGKAFSHVLPAVETPDQRAIVVYAGGRERLAIETRFRGPDAELYAWVVPLPAPPRVSCAAPELFDEATELSMYVVREPDWTSTTVVASMLGFTAVLGFLSTGARPLRLRWILLLLIGCLFVISAATTPTLGMSGVHVIDRHRVGAYDVATVESVDPGSLLRWLRENGFAVPDEAATAIGAYVRQGWVFAVAKVTAGESGAVKQPEPLLFEFDSPMPIYPMRLTGAAAREALELDLCVFADRPVRCANLEAVRCTVVEPHGALRQTVGDARVLTRLAGRLTPEEMSQDLVLEWEGDLDGPIDNTEAAAASALAVGGGATLLALLPLASILLFWRARLARLSWMATLFSAQPKLGRRGLLHVWLTALAVGAVAAGIAYTVTVA